MYSVYIHVLYDMRWTPRASSRLRFVIYHHMSCIDVCIYHNCQNVIKEKLFSTWMFSRLYKLGKYYIVRET